MRSFHNGTLLTEKGGKMPIKNTMRVPLFNNPAPNVMKMLSPERLFRKFVLSLKQMEIFHSRFLFTPQCLGIRVRIKIPLFSPLAYYFYVGTIPSRNASNVLIPIGVMRIFFSVPVIWSSLACKILLCMSTYQLFSDPMYAPTMATNKRYIPVLGIFSKRLHFVSGIQ